MNPLLELKRLGQRVWLDNLSRTHLLEGGLQRLIEQDGLAGITSNPTIFYKAIAESPHYRDDLARLKISPLPTEPRYESLVIPDIQAACDLLRPVWEQSRGEDGYVSLEVSPQLAYDEEGTIAAAKRLTAAVSRDNLLVKVPATPEGVRAFERLIGEGYKINVTLMFSLKHLEDIEEAYIRGLRRWILDGGDPHRVKSVASLFLSRVDTLVDKKLEAIGTPEALALRGKSGVALAKLAYAQYHARFHGPEFADLAHKGARRQHPLWASTGTKNPAYSDVLYVEPLIGAETVNTLPDATLAAFRDHGKAAPTVEQGVKEAEAQFAALGRLGIDMLAVGEELQTEGVRLFDESYTKLLELVS
jgi:transaldolase